MSFRHKRRHNPTTTAKPLTAAQVERLLYGQSIPDKHQRERLEQARKELQVPDLKSALTKALEDGRRNFLTATVQEWDNHEQEIRHEQPKEKDMTFTKTGNVSHDTFNFIKANAHIHTAATACRALEAMGYNRSSVHALITQMKRVEFLKYDTHDKLFAAVPEYKPFQNPYKTNPAGKKKAKAAKVQAPKSAGAGIAALKPVETRIVPAAWDADTVLAHIGVKEAFKLYEALSQMFGGK